MYMGEAGEYAIVYLCKDHHDDRACAEPVVTAFGRTPEISDAARAVFAEHVERLCLNLDDFKFYHHERESKRGVDVNGVHCWLRMTTLSLRSLAIVWQKYKEFFAYFNFCNPASSVRKLPMCFPCRQAFDDMCLSVCACPLVSVFVQCPLHTGEEEHSCKVEDIQAAQNVDYDKVGINRPRVTSQTGDSQCVLVHSITKWQRSVRPRPRRHNTPFS